MKGEGRRLIEKYLSEGKRVVLYCDMDGVVANFEGAAEEYNLSCKEFKMMKDAYLKIKPYKHAFEILKKIEALGVDIQMATKIPDENPYAATDKLLWLLEYAPERAVDVTITNDKGALGNEWDLLMDDRPHKARVEDFKGHLLHFGENGEFKNWEVVVDYFDLQHEF